MLFERLQQNAMSLGTTLMRLSLASRIVLILALLGFVWMINAGPADPADAPTASQRVVGIVVSSVALLFAIGLAFPRRGRVATRIVAGCVVLAYLAYFVTELIELLRGEQQEFTRGEPSALMAGIGLLVWGVPMIVYALGGPSPLELLSGKWRKPDNDDNA